MSKSPMQPIILDGDGVPRFKSNHVVEHLLSLVPEGLNKLAIHRPEFPKEDWEQFYQLIGYSVSGFGELSYTSGKAVRKADKKAAKLLKTQTPPHVIYENDHDAWQCFLNRQKTK